MPCCLLAKLAGAWQDAFSLHVALRGLLFASCCRYLDDGCHLALQAIVALVQGKMQSGGVFELAHIPAAATLCMIRV
jgi:hypothetical protein